MFSYKEYKIYSAVPFADIKTYFCELGAKEKSGFAYEYDGLEIEITVGQNSALQNLNVPQHTIRVRGNSDLAAKFLNGFRFRFLSAGG